MGRTATKPAPRWPGEVRTLVCPECGAPLRLRDSRFGPFYGCVRFPDCRATHGAHPDGAPLGVPADKPTKAARIAAHEVFDRLWQEGHMRRRQAYRWMRGAIGMTKEEAHIGRFDIARCRRLMELVQIELAQLGRADLERWEEEGGARPA